MKPFSARDFEAALDLACIEGEDRLLLMAELLRLRDLRAVVAARRYNPPRISAALDNAPRPEHAERYRTALAEGHRQHNRDLPGLPGLLARH